MVVVRSFHRYRGETSFTLPKLVAILREQLPLIAPQQTRYRVTTLPTERTIRFYTAKKLVDKPVGRERQLALYGYRHLLQILAVKYLQSQYLPLRKVRSLVEDATNRDLEQLLPEIAASSWAGRDFTRHDRRVGADRGPRPADGMRREALSDASLTTSPSPPAGAADTLPRQAAPAAADLDTWHRLEVGPGIELHVHAAALTAENRERLRGTLLRELGALRGWFGGSGES